MAYVPNPVDVTQPLDSVFASTAAAEFRALKAYIQTIVSGGGLGVATPGQISQFPGVVPPPGWLPCDGGVYLRSTFANLYAAAIAMNAVTVEATWATGYFGYFSSGDLVSTFRVPDLRGVFPRYWNGGKAGVTFDPARQAGLIQAATEVFNNGGNAGAMIIPFTAGSVENADYAENLPNGSWNQVVPAATNISVLQSAGVRPTNIALQVCVKT